MKASVRKCAPAATLQELFGRYGEVSRLVLPDTHVLALVEFLETGKLFPTCLIVLKHISQHTHWSYAYWTAPSIAICSVLSCWLPTAFGLAQMPGDVRSAFRGLAYRRLQHVPLYLEWAPAGIFTGPAKVHTLLLTITGIKQPLDRSAVPHMWPLKVQRTAVRQPCTF